MGRTRDRRSRTPVGGALVLAVLLCSALVALALSLPAGAAGILPPDNPPGNIAPSSTDFLTSIDTARAQEGVGPLDISEATFSGLPVTEQAFIVVNDERIDRGLPAISYMTSQLNADAQQGADAGGDPGFPTSMGGGAQMTWGGSIWAGGLTSVLEADFYWMYSDGYGGAAGETTNSDCSSPSAGDCWGHRDIILHRIRFVRLGYTHHLHGRRILVDRRPGRFARRPVGGYVRASTGRHHAHLGSSRRTRAGAAARRGHRHPRKRPRLLGSRVEW